MSELTFSSPGVYVEELPEPMMIIGASADIAGFVGYTQKGPVNEAIQVHSWSQFVDEFGGFAFAAPMPMAVYAFFANGGSICNVVRIAQQDQIAAKAVIGDLTFTASIPGDWGNMIAVQIDNSPPGSATQSDGFTVQVLGKSGASGLISTLIEEYVRLNDREIVTVGGEDFHVLESYTIADASEAVPIEERINGLSQFVRVAVSASATRPDNTATPVGLAGGYGNWNDTPLVVAPALKAMEPVKDVSLIVAPDIAMIDDVTQQRKIALEMLELCGARQEYPWFAILDAPCGLDPNDLVNYVDGAAGKGFVAGVALPTRDGGP